MALKIWKPLKAPNIMQPLVVTPKCFGYCMKPVEEYKTIDEILQIPMNLVFSTMTVAFKFQGGVILAIDSRTNIVPQECVKLVKINNALLSTLSGGVADCTYWQRVLTTDCCLHKLRNDSSISVAGASRLVSNTASKFQDLGFNISVMLAGYDHSGPALYYVNAEGTQYDGIMFAVGRGSGSAMEFLYPEYSANLTDEMALELGRRAVYYATLRNAGGEGIMIRVYHISSAGLINISNTDWLEMHNQYRENLMN